MTYYFMTDQITMYLIILDTYNYCILFTKLCFNIYLTIFNKYLQNLTLTCILQLLTFIEQAKYEEESILKIFICLLNYLSECYHLIEKECLKQIDCYLTTNKPVYDSYTISPKNLLYMYHYNICCMYLIIWLDIYMNRIYDFLLRFCSVYIEIIIMINRLLGYPLSNILTCLHWSCHAELSKIKDTVSKVHHMYTLFVLSLNVILYFISSILYTYMIQMYVFIMGNLAIGIVLISSILIIPYLIPIYIINE